MGNAHLRAILALGEFRMASADGGSASCKAKGAAITYTAASRAAAAW